MPKKEKPAKKLKKSWPTKDAMAQVYAMSLWGGSTSDFYSGDGSHDASLIAPYLEAVTAFLSSFETPLTVCDLGCGDFNIGKELVRHTQKYVAVDIVPELITRNKEKFRQENLEFQCLDIGVAELPVGDCAILRQVLQHLSNTEVQRIVAKLSLYKYVILTEHLPEGHFVPNIDIISGQGIRLKKQSGINLTAPPFNLKVVAEKELLSVTATDGKGVIVTRLYSFY